MATDNRDLLKLAPPIIVPRRENLVIPTTISTACIHDQHQYANDGEYRRYKNILRWEHRKYAAIKTAARKLMRRPRGNISDHSGRLVP